MAILNHYGLGVAYSTFQSAMKRASFVDVSLSVSYLLQFNIIAILVTSSFYLISVDIYHSQIRSMVIPYLLSESL